MSDLDIGRCFCVNLRAGMVIAFLFQAAIFGLTAGMIAMYYLYLEFPFEWIRPALLNDITMIYFVTSGLAVFFGFLVNLFKSFTSHRMRCLTSDLARIWMWLTYATIPLQIIFGLGFAFTCTYVLRSLTVSLIIQEHAMNEIIGLTSGSNGGTFGSFMTQGENGIEVIRQKPDFYGHVTGNSLESIRNKLKEKYRSYSGWIDGIYKRNKVTIWGSILVITLFASMFTEEIRMTYDYYKSTFSNSSMPDLYGWGRNSLVAMVIFGLVPMIVQIVVAIHISGFQSTLRYGGKGDEMVGWTRIRWFYSLTESQRRKVRLGDNRNDEHLDLEASEIMMEEDPITDFEAYFDE
jgi:hypothetical protein